ncbi:metal ABC transporter permease [Kiloniella laminariae]|uniref:Metal ABC transporter permease n=1 Tax=Kiloniella laminariae TaxID=454162 RepID=A0ABT4LQZ9_9PROT|nr:metal ABC transporter permease [Kiloniella laminariae]MCZ4282372.1 metal ABC transporter permease [Kiloniella laminariae]
MDLPLADFLQIDLPALLVAVLAGLCCGLPGNFLVLRRQSLIGDAMSHVVLPGIVVGYLLSGTLDTLPMLLGALSAALISAVLIEGIKRLGKIEAGAAMGVVFTSMFALGVLILEQTGASGVHLDVEHALYGNLESTLWLGLNNWQDLVSPSGLEQMPNSLQRLLGVCLLVILLTVAFFKELKISTFDPEMASSLGFSARLISIGLVIITALSAVAAFDAVGSILVIAMFICPAATARMWTDCLSRQLWLSAFFATLSGITGYLVAAFGPLLLGADFALNAAGMIAVIACVFQGISMIFAPDHGKLGRVLKQRHALKMKQNLP